jgi:hypothetical protein
MTRAPLLFLLLAACEPADTTDDSHIVGPGDCEVGIESTFPADGATDAYYRGTVEFTLTEPDPTATVFADFEGVQTTRDDGLTVVFTPTDPLEPLTSYEVGLDYCRGTPSIEFTTSGYGLPVEDPQGLRGRTWAYDLRDARFYEAGYLGDLLQTFAERVGLVSVVGIEGDMVDLRMAVADDSEPPGQDFCARTVDVEGVDFSGSPYLQFGPTSIEFQAYLGIIAIHEMIVQATVAPDGASLGGMVISAVIDVRSVANAVDMDLVELCELLEVYGAPCEACPEDSEPYCVSTAADRLGAAGVATTVERINQAYSDPRCEEEPTEEP